MTEVTMGARVCWVTRSGTESSAASSVQEESSESEESSEDGKSSEDELGTVVFRGPGPLVGSRRAAGVAQEVVVVSSEEEDEEEREVVVVSSEEEDEDGGGRSSEEEREVERLRAAYRQAQARRLARRAVKVKAAEAAVGDGWRG